MLTNNQYPNSINTDSIGQKYSVLQDDINKNTGTIVTEGIVIASSETDNYCIVNYKTPEGNPNIAEAGKRLEIGNLFSQFPNFGDVVKLETKNGLISIVDTLLTWEEARNKLCFSNYDVNDSHGNSASGNGGIFVNG